MPATKRRGRTMSVRDYTVNRGSLFVAAARGFTANLLSSGGRAVMLMILPPRRETMRLWWNCGTRVGLAGLVTWMAAGSLVAQAIAGTAGYPVAPRPLPDSDEIRLARTAAPAEISGAATVYAVRDGDAQVLVQGTNGCACMVSRDLHAGSLYPICFDVEATRFVLP